MLRWCEMLRWAAKTGISRKHQSARLNCSKRRVPWKCWSSRTTSCGRGYGRIRRLAGATTFHQHHLTPCQVLNGSVRDGPQLHSIHRAQHVVLHEILRLRKVFDPLAREASLNIHFHRQKCAAVGRNVPLNRDLQYLINDQCLQSPLPLCCCCPERRLLFIGEALELLYRPLLEDLTERNMFRVECPTFPYFLFTFFPKPTNSCFL